ncbi:MAG: type II secretion system F family protein, partial [Acidobacteriota bacterium]
MPILEKVLFARYFALMLRAGLDVKRALGGLQEQTRSKPLKEALRRVYQDIEKGETLSNSMQQHPNIFSPLFVSFVRVGESTGQLQESLDILAKQLQKEYELRRAVRGGMLYPTVILVALFAVGFAMMVFVVPKLVEVFEGFDVELPLMTRILIAISGFFTSYWYIVLIGLAALVALSWLLLRVKSIKGALLHGFLYVPIIGPIMKKINLARFSRNLSSLLSSGVAFIEALHILGENTPHPSYAAVLTAAQDHVKQGKVLSEFLVEFKRLFPPLVTHIIKVGEDTGE